MPSFAFFRCQPTPGRSPQVPRRADECRCPEARWYRAELALCGRAKAKALAVEAAIKETEVRDEGGTPLFVEEDGEHVCCPLVGPVFPVLGKLSLLHVGQSPTLPRDVFLAWRVFMLIIATATTAACVAASWGSRNWFRVFAPVLVLLAEARRLALVVAYRRRAEDKGAIRGLHKSYGFDALVHQSVAVLILLTTVAAMVARISPTFAYITAGAPRFDAANVFLILLAIICVVDVWASPIPFRILYVFAATFLTVVASTIAVFVSGARVDMRVTAIVVSATAMIIGFPHHLYGRGIYLWVHRDRVIAEQKVTLAVGEEAV